MPERVLLVTGFGAFPGVAVNPTAQVAEALAQPLAGWQIVSAVLPVAWRSARDQVADLVAQHQPACIVHLGVATDAQRLRIERQGVNALRFRVPDTAGEQPQEGEVEGGAAAALVTAVAVDALVAHLSALGFDAEVSDDAGRYVCNATYFSSLHNHRDARVLFVHLPAVSDIWPEARLTAASAAVLAWLSS